MLPLSLSPPPRVNHFVNSNDMVTKIKASTILHAEASLTSIYLAKTPATYALPRIHRKISLMKNLHKDRHTLSFNQMV